MTGRDAQEGQEALEGQEDQESQEGQEGHEGQERMLSLNTPIVGFSKTKSSFFF